VWPNAVPLAYGHAAARQETQGTWLPWPAAGIPPGRARLRPAASPRCAPSGERAVCGKRHCPTELTIAAVGALLTALAAALLASTDNHSLGAFLGVLGLSGITTSGIVAKARTQPLALLGKLREALDADLVVEAVVVQPWPPEPKPCWRIG
jgi:hypothetical protein